MPLLNTIIFTILASLFVQVTPLAPPFKRDIEVTAPPTHALSPRKYEPKQSDTRKDFTTGTVSNWKAKYPTHTVIVCNVGYEITGRWGLEKSVALQGSTKMIRQNPISFDIIVIGNHTIFTRKGDGGYQNWAFDMNADRCTWNDPTISCE